MSIVFPIKQAKTLDIEFDEKLNAFSKNYSDIYFQPSIGVEEKKHVFLKGNNLPHNWKDRESFTIAETGFGLGINFLNTLKLWHETSKTNQHLNYICCELHPLDFNQLKLALSQFLDLSKYSDTLLEHYPQELIYGFHRLHFNKFNLTLTLIIGDATSSLKELKGTVDAWYLDGFAPTKNPDMWTEGLFTAIGSLSKIGTTLATYTVARKIRDRLNNCGYKITKTKGFGQKREMLTAHMQKLQNTTSKQPWAQSFEKNTSESYAIIGAGIAGLSLAHKLTLAGKKVILIDRQKRPCLETSGNPQAMVMPSLSLNDSVESRFYLSAFLYAQRYYFSKFFHKVGVYELAFTDNQKYWQDKFLHRFKLPKSLVQKYKKGLLYTNSGWLDTQGHAEMVFSELCTKLNFSYQQSEIGSIKYKNNKWYLENKTKSIQKTDCLILANSISIKKLYPDYKLPITPKHGQINFFKSSNVNAEISKCPHILLNKGYITPSWNNEQTMGATFTHLDRSEWFNPAKTNPFLLQKNKNLWKAGPYNEVVSKIDSDKSRAGIRVTTPDHLPICGAVIDQDKFKIDYHDIKHGKKWKQYPPPKHLNSLYIFTGLGSRGFTSAPILAESLCNQILGRPQVLNNEILKAVTPNRFLYKSLKKGIF